MFWYQVQYFLLMLYVHSSSGGTGTCYPKPIPWRNGFLGTLNKDLLHFLPNFGNIWRFFKVLQLTICFQSSLVLHDSVQSLSLPLFIYILIYDLITNLQKLPWWTNSNCCWILLWNGCCCCWIFSSKGFLNHTNFA